MKYLSHTVKDVKERLEDYLAKTISQESAGRCCLNSIHCVIRRK
jgi:hypothetical protein